MTQSSATQLAENTVIRPFEVNFPEAEVTELRRRINATRWRQRRALRGLGTTGAYHFRTPHMFQIAALTGDHDD